VATNALEIPPSLRSLQTAQFGFCKPVPFSFVCTIITCS
jgi:hypothetical protein